jgi:hypothetical protein
MNSDFAFVMMVYHYGVPYTGYYLQDDKQRFRLKFISNNYGYFLPKERQVPHMDENLSYSALMTRKAKAKTYTVERVMYPDIKDTVETAEEELMLRLL